MNRLHLRLPASLHRELRELARGGGSVNQARYQFRSARRGRITQGS